MIEAMVDIQKQAYCTGANNKGQGGNGSTANATSPSQVAGGFTDWVMVRADWVHTCGLRSNGLIYCWGANSDGQLGDGTTTDHTSPAEISGGFSDWIMVDIDRLHTCGVRSNGRAYCWGSNWAGQLGDGTITSRSTPTEVSGGYTDWTVLDSEYNTTCGIRKPGRLWCWGRNSEGQIGDGTATNQSTPTEVSGGYTDWITFDNGSRFTCGIRGSGLAYCWGLNDTGQLGTGDTTNYSTPHLVSGGYTDWVYISGDDPETCGIRQNGLRTCWGMNSNGQFGNGSTSWAVQPLTDIPNIQFW
jgi:alpha-tubulin suppressor-like RCC1 family protein